MPGVCLPDKYAYHHVPLGAYLPPPGSPHLYSALMPYPVLNSLRSLSVRLTEVQTRLSHCERFSVGVWEDPEFGCYVAASVLLGVSKDLYDIRRCVRQIFSDLVDEAPFDELCVRYEGKRVALNPETFTIEGPFPSGDSLSQGDLSL